jgi:hypothetical protein
MNCPKCKNANTQYIELIIKAGTHTIKTTTSTSGVVVSSSGSVGHVSASSSTTGQAVSELAKELSMKFAPTQSNTAGWLIIGILVASLVLTYFLVSLMSSTLGKNPWAIGIPGVVLFVAVLTFAYPRFLKVMIEKEKSNNKRSLELWQRWSTKGCFCHTCGHTFIPGSDEVFKAVE